MANISNKQKSDPCVHMCLKCGDVAEVLPESSIGRHDEHNCGGLICMFQKYTKEAYNNMTDEEKEAVHQETLRMAGRPSNASKSRINNYSTNLPHCPMCKSTDFSKISTGSRMASIFAFGLASSSIGKQYKCNKCGHKW